MQTVSDCDPYNIEIAAPYRCNAVHLKHLSHEMEAFRHRTQLLGHVLGVARFGSVQDDGGSGVFLCGHFLFCVFSVFLQCWWHRWVWEQMADGDVALDGSSEYGRNFFLLLYWMSVILLVTSCETEIAGFVDNPNY